MFSALFKAWFSSTKTSKFHFLPLTKGLTLLLVLASSVDIATNLTLVSNFHLSKSLLIASNSLIHGTHHVAQKL